MRITGSILHFMLAKRSLGTSFLYLIKKGALNSTVLLKTTLGLGSVIVHKEVVCLLCWCHSWRHHEVL